LNPELCNLNGQSYSDILKNYYSQNPSQLKKIP
jgi:hypothetical protein